MAEWESAPNWTPFEEINGGQQFSKQFSAQALNALAENIAYLYEHQPTATPIFDGTINIESGNTTISGSYLINQKKAYDALRALTSTKTFAVEFGAGSVPDGGDEMNFTSMTFDATNELIKYGDIEAFRCDTYMTEGDGFAGYNSAGGTGNGARINFAEGTECRKAFKELFLSIADVNDLAPEEPAEDELAGTWVFNNTLSLPYDQVLYYVNFTCNGVSYNTMGERDAVEPSPDDMWYYGTTVVYNDLAAQPWKSEVYKTITITSKLSEVTNGSTLLAWLKANATKQ